MRKFLLWEQRISPKNPMIDQLRIFCKTALRGVLAFYNDQTQAKGYLGVGSRHGRRFYEHKKGPGG